MTNSNRTGSKLCTIKTVECSETFPSDKYKGHATPWKSAHGIMQEKTAENTCTAR